MKGYKGFDKGLICNGKHYTEGASYEDAEGISFSRNPLNTPEFLGFMDENGELREFAEVEALSTVNIVAGRKCSSKLRINKKLGIPGLIEAFTSFITEKIMSKKSCKGYNSAAVSTAACSATFSDGTASVSVSTGDNSTATAEGFLSAAVSTGHSTAAFSKARSSVAVNTGDHSVANSIGAYSATISTSEGSVSANTGISSVAICAGCDSIATNTGVDSIAVASAIHSVAINEGARALAVATGYDSIATVQESGSIAIVTGRGSKVKGNLGCWIIAAEQNTAGQIVSLVSAKVDGIKIKPDTFYIAKNGEFAEAFPNSSENSDDPTGYFTER